MRPKLGPAAVKLIEGAVESLFSKIRAHSLGNEPPTGKQLYISYKPELTLSGLFHSAAQEEGAVPDKGVLKTLLNISGSYIDAAQARAKAKVLHAVHSAIQEAGHKGEVPKIRKVLEEKLAEVMEDAQSDMRRILETESTTVRNVSIYDGIIKGNLLAGVSDPICYWHVVRDEHACDTCKRLHLLSDETTPRLWKLSQAKSGYGKHDDEVPCIGPRHPNCRCILGTLLPGYTFKNGRVTYHSPGWDEYANQQK